MNESEQNEERQKRGQRKLESDKLQETKEKPVSALVTDWPGKR